MNIYKYTPLSETYNSATIKSTDVYVEDLFAEGVRINGELPPFELEKCDVNTPSDFPFLHGWIPLLSLHAWGKLSASIRSSVEPFMVKLGSDDFVMLNVIDVIDCLDRSRSEISVNKITKDITNVRKYAFFEECVKNKLIFKIPETLGFDVYITEDFKHLVENAGLKGLYFDKPLNADDEH